MPIYAIGDVQGCFDDMQRLIEKINFDPALDSLWFCGDIINRGPNSLETIRYIKDLGDNAVTVLGNHDLHFLAVAYVTDKPSKHDTFSDILNAPDREDLVNWLRHQKLFHHDTELNISMVHAGVPAGWSIKDAVHHSSEMESVLQQDNPIEFFNHMYGNQPRTWNNALTGWDRYRFITNVFTRMRFCDEEGRPDFKYKNDIGTQPEHLTPWFMHQQRLTKNDEIIFGHWSTLTNITTENIYALDTGCLWGGQLTALKIENGDRKLIQVECPNGIKPY